MARQEGTVWVHMCKAIRAISHRFDESCPYCGLTRTEALAKAQRRRRSEDEGGEEDDDGSDTER